ncbi:GroES-like protein [Polyplosphaeria fusca]|uniref:alcohol dehydrogenase (NADP(+)) n=1 Tax=Polyplosphaeria fusca TaxID=682080 RepID=A0A9P4QU88_9PLEO|nr:GroES-like protein [Polyplosphaeria fusca]
MSHDYKFEGWLGFDSSATEGNMVWGEFEPKKWEETDIDIKVTHCGVCGSDLHTLRSGWGATDYPCCVGHEIVGIAVRVGTQAVGDIEVGDRVGVGAQSDSCQQSTCEACTSGNEQYCPTSLVGTYADRHRNGDKSYGGYSTYNRCPSRFVIKIPDGLASADAAPLLCAGVTTYSPLIFNGAGPGKRVGVIGLGGLGHLAIQWGRALGAEVVAISRKSNKKEDAMLLGANSFIATDEEKDWSTKYNGTLDIILCAVSSAKMPYGEYLDLLRRDGVFVHLGIPDDGAFSLPPGKLTFKRLRVMGSFVGSPNEIRDMLQLAVGKGVKPWVHEVSMKEANRAIIEFEEGKPRYRYVLVNEDAGAAVP